MNNVHERSFHQNQTSLELIGEQQKIPISFLPFILHFLSSSGKFFKKRKNFVPRENRNIKTGWIRPLDRLRFYLAFSMYRI